MVLATNSDHLDLIGVFQARLFLSHHSCSTAIHVFKTLKVSLLSLQFCIKLCLLERGWSQSRIWCADILSVSEPLFSQTKVFVPLPTAGNLDSVKSALPENTPLPFRRNPPQLYMDLP